MKTLADAKASRIAESLNISSTDARFVQFLNEAMERLLVLGKWWDTFGRYNISIDSQTLTLPAEVATIEQIAVGNTPLPLRSLWFELLGSGWSVRDETTGVNTGIDECLFRGTAPTFKDMSADSTLTAKCDVSEDHNKTVRILGYDSSDNWVRTKPDGVTWEDGEVLTFDDTTGLATTTTTFSRVTGVLVEDEMEGQWWLYQGNSVTGTMIGQYAYWETAPSYKRYLVPFVNTDVSTVVLTGKKAFRPVVNDGDPLIIGNIAALKLACVACKYEEEGNPAMASLLINGGVTKAGRVTGAVQLLQAELNHHTGDGEQTGINIIGAGAGFGDYLPTETMV